MSALLDNRTLEQRLTESSAYQGAMGEILRVISPSPTDVQPVLDTIAGAVLALCHAQFANVFTYDGRLIHLKAIVNVNVDYVERLRSFFPRPAGRDTVVTRAIADCAVCMIPDVLADPEYEIAGASAVGGANVADARSSKPAEGNCQDVADNNRADDGHPQSTVDALTFEAMWGRGRRWARDRVNLMWPKPGHENRYTYDQTRAP